MTNVIQTKDLSALEVNFDTIVSEQIGEIQLKPLFKSPEPTETIKYGIIGFKEKVDIISQLNFEIDLNIDREENLKDKQELLKSFKPKNQKSPYQITKFKMANMFVEFNFSHYSVNNQENKAWFSICQEDFDNFSTYADKVQNLITESIGNKFRFFSSIRKDDDFDEENLVSVKPTKIRCTYENQIANQLINRNRKRSGKCFVALKTSNMATEITCSYQLEFEIVKITFD